MIYWNRVLDETTHHLICLLKTDTSNPPGSETAACQYLAGVLEREGIPSVILEGRPGRGNLVARLPGEGRGAPLLLMAHLDVVSAEAEAWTVPPFDGQVQGGYLYGRGALDTKQLAAIELMIVLLLHREKVPLARDVILMANADEETGGLWGAGWMIKEHPDLIRSEYAINEGGGFNLEISGKRFYPVQTGEKGTARFTMRTHGHPGHGSQPHDDNAVVKLARAVERLASHQFTAHVSPTVRTFVEQVAGQLPTPERDRWRDLVNTRNAKTALDHLPVGDGIRAMLHAMMHNTATPTMLQAGSKINVIPSTAEARVDARIVPGQSERDFERELRQALPSEVEIEFAQSRMGLEANYQSPLFDSIRRTMAVHDPAAAVVPFLSSGATDARHLCKLGTQVYGFCPMLGASSELERVHGHDERISLQNIGFGVQVLYDVVRDFCTRG